jgi:hypothetical protein
MDASGTPPPRAPSPARGALVAGVLLVIVGVALLVVQQTGVDLAWPAWIALFGVGMIVASLFSGPAGPPFAVLGGMLLMLGLVLAVQAETGFYASWIYAWALVAPGGVGVGLILYGLLTGRWRTMRSGFGPLVAGIALFLVGYLFFEGILGVSGEAGKGPLGDLAVPLMLVVLGALLVLGAFLPPRWRGADAWPSAQTMAGPSPGSTSGAAPAGSGTGDEDARPIGVDLAGATAADVAISFGAGRLEIAGSAAPGRLVDGTAYGGSRLEAGGPGRIRLVTPSERFWRAGWGDAPFHWRLGLTAEVPLRLACEIGAAKADLDLSGLRLAELRVRCGASDVDLVLPAAAGQTRVDLEGGAASLRLRIPDGVAARIHSTMALGATDVDTRRFPPDPMGGWASPDFPTAPNRVEIEARGGVGSIQIR